MYDELIKRLRETPSIPVDAKLHNEAADAIEELKKKLYFQDITTAQILEMYMPFFIPKWIPVTERLPEEYTSILFVAGSGDVHVGYYDSEHKIWCDMTGFRYVCTHWMPLPEPPKEET